ncbi:MAG: DUF420 domain-containing protein [Halarchaeum sp.]
MRSFVTRHPSSVSAPLSVAALALVVACVRGVLPATLLPVHEPLVALVPTLNAAISVAAIATIAVGWRSIRRGDVARHRALMTASAALFAGFLALYCYRLVVHDTTAFGGPDVVYRFVYLPVLVVHMALAVVCVPLVVHALVLAATRPASALADTLHPRVGRVAAPLWTVSFALGVVVYLLLYVAY